MHVVTRPAGATVSIGGKTLGRTPLTASVTGFTFLPVKITLNGYNAFSSKVYVKKDLQPVAATLQRAGKHHR